MLGLHAVFSGCWNKFSTWNILDCHLLYNAGFGKALIGQFIADFYRFIILKNLKSGRCSICINQRYRGHYLGPHQTGKF